MTYNHNESNPRDIMRASEGDERPGEGAPSALFAGTFCRKGAGRRVREALFVLR